MVIGIRQFIKRALGYGIMFFLIIEILSRLFIDSVYFSSIDSYRVPDVNEETYHIDNLFIGSSRVPATIDVNLWNELELGKINVVAGKGFSTPGTHIQALISKLERYPDFIRDSNVFLEYTGISIYSNAFAEDRFKIMESNRDGVHESNVHSLLPYLKSEDLPHVLRQASNSWEIRIEICLKYLFSSFRTRDMVNENFHKRSYLDPTRETVSRDLVNEGGIRSDKIKETRALAIKEAKLMVQRTMGSDQLNDEKLEKSSLAYLDDLIRSHGGRLYLYEIPLHSVQKEVVSGNQWHWPLCMG